METISIGFSYHKNNLLSNLIRLVEGSPYSHVYIRRKSKYGEYVYQASGLAVNFTNIDTFLEHNVVVEEYEFEIPQDKQDALLRLCIKYAGRPYGVKALFQIAVKMLFKKIHVNVDLRGDGDDTFICSEMGALICKEILGINIPDDIDFESPKDLYPYVAAHGKRII